MERRGNHRGAAAVPTRTASSSRSSSNSPTRRPPKASPQKRVTAVVVLAALMTVFALVALRSNNNHQNDSPSTALPPRQQQTVSRLSSKLWREPSVDRFSLEELRAHPTAPPAKALKVNYPIFVASFSKSGTTSTYYAFECYLGAQYVAHRWTTDANHRKGPGRPELIGRCMEQNVLVKKRPPFDGCGKNHFNRTQTVVWTDTSYIGGERGCYNPNLEALEAIWEAHPTATLLLVRRNATAWFRSADSKRAGFVRKWSNKCPGMPNTRNESEWVEFYQNYTERVRKFAQERRAQMKYVELELENPDSGKILEKEIGIPASCWKRCPSSFTMEGCYDLKKNETAEENKAG